jgi:Tfp pilus assembly protein PilV
MTMSEVLIAAVLLSFVVMGGITALSQSYTHIRHARMVTLAGQILQTVMEDLRLSNYSQLKAYAAQQQPVDLTPLLASERFTSNFTAGFTLSGAFTTLVASGTGTPGKLQAQLTVAWLEDRAPFQRTTLSYFGELGLSDYIYVGWAP